MKKISIALLLVLSASAAIAQSLKESDVPPAIVNAFNARFKNAGHTSWEQGRDGMYEASFEQDHKKQEASFLPDGVVFKTGTEVDAKELPASAAEYISKNYAGYKISEVMQTLVPSGNITYEAKLKKGKTELRLIFGTTGIFVEQK